MTVGRRTALQKMPVEDGILAMPVSSLCVSVIFCRFQAIQNLQSTWLESQWHATGTELLLIPCCVWQPLPHPPGSLFKRTNGSQASEYFQ